MKKLLLIFIFSFHITVIEIGMSIVSSSSSWKKCSGGAFLFAQGTWTQKASHPGGGRYAIVGFSIGAKGYIGTGLDAANANTKAFWEWDQATDVWTQKADFGGTARYYAAGFVIGSKGYIGTGFDGNTNQDFWEWDQATNVWTQRTDFGGGPRMRARGFSIGNKGYFTAGTNPNVYANMIMDLWEYDPNLNPPMGTWTAKASFPGTPRIYPTLFSICGKGYLGNGYIYAQGVSVNDFWEYNPASDLWTQKTNFPGVPSNQTVGFGIGSKGYMGVGRSAYNGTFLTQFFEYDQGTDTWATMASFAGAPRAYSMGFAICDKGYVGTGIASGGAMADFWEFTSPSNNPPTIQTNPTCKESNDATVSVSPNCGAPPYTYSWNSVPVQTTPTATGLTVGSYSVNILDAKGCTSTATVNIVPANPSPLANFGYTKVCKGASTPFIDSSLAVSGIIDSWNWNFGDGSPVNTTQNPSHVYAAAGNYTVTLIVNNNFGCADTITKPVQVYYNPIAGFTADNVCFGDTVYFTNTSSVHNSATIGTYLWEFGDSGPTNSLQNPVHYYSGAGTYTVTLVTTSIDGCSDATINTVKAFDAPVSGMVFSNTCLFEAAVFTNSTTDPVMGSTAGWLWNFGDGTATESSAWSPNHLYAAPGNYQVTLITYSSNLACVDTLQDTITVFPMPFANFTAADRCLNQTTNFIDSSAVSSGNIAGWSWDFGDSSPLNTIQDPGHTYTNPGTYSVSLIVTTNTNCKDTVTKNIVVHPLPVAQFSTSNVCDGSIVPFTNLSTIITTDTIQEWAWNFGDGSPVFNNPNTSHLYAANGSYPVQLSVVSNFGCSDSITKMSIINPNPVVNFTASDTIGCETLCVIFQNGSSIATGNNADVIWNFGNNGSANNSENPIRCYVNDSIYAPNFFDVTLTVNSDSGCVTTLLKNNYITVYPNPNAAFVVQPETATITDPVISIKDLSVGVNFWNWNFGDGSDSSSLFNPGPHTYADTGVYTITLIVSTQYNCIDTANETVIIEPDFVFYIPNAFTPNDDGVNDTFTGRGIFVHNFEMTIFDRWGNLIFFSDDINKPWDGRADQGNEVAQGDVYVYSIKITDFKKGKHSYKGIVTLVR